MKLKTRFVENFPVQEMLKSEENPRFINVKNFEKLCQSIREFPEMLKIRPIVLNQKNEIIAGNMRFEAVKLLNFESVPVLICEKISTKKQREFVIKDNVSFGFWDFEQLSNEWQIEDLLSWGLKIPDFEQPPEFDDEDQDDAFEINRGKKFLKLKFFDEHFDEAKKIFEFWEKRGLYVGAFLIEKLKELENE